MSSEWLLIDGSSLIFRAYHGVPASVRAPDGHQVNAVRGFLESLTRLLWSRRPARLAMAEDEDWRPAWRVELIPSYKAHRTAEPVPPALEPQMSIIDAILDATGIDRAGLADYEAEDVIASWTAATPAQVEIVSGDRDLFALVEDPRVVVLYPERAGLAVIDETEVTRRYGVPGRRYADFAILRGDPSDGLPGLRGVGAVAAASLVRAHGGIEGLLRDGRLTEVQAEYVTRAVQVVRPVAGLPVPLPAGRRDAYPADAEKLSELARTHGVAATVERLLEALNVTIAAGRRSTSTPAAPRPRPPLEDAPG